MRKRRFSRENKEKISFGVSRRGKTPIFAINRHYDYNGVSMNTHDTPPPSTYEGIAVSQGVAIGKAFLLQTSEIIVEVRDITDQEIKSEYKRFDDAIKKSRGEILSLREKFDTSLKGDVADILRAHIQLLEDASLIQQVKERVRQTKKNIDYVYNSIVMGFVERLRAVDNEMIAERAQDLLDIRNRVLKHLLNRGETHPRDVKTPVIFVAHTLSPSDTLAFDRNMILAFVVDVGGRTSHTAILARSLGIPAVIGVETLSANVKNGDTLIVDGANGIVILNPTDDLIAEHEKAKTVYDRMQKDSLRFTDVPAVTKDGKSITIEANIEFPSEVSEARRFGAEGVGLYRSEFLYMNENAFPSEEEQFENYKRVVEAMNGREVVIRTLDLGGDKFLSSRSGAQTAMPLESDMNPFLGWRAIRFCLANPDIFKTQLRAILRASAFGNASVMFPMIANLEEYRRTILYLEEAKAELKSEGIPFKEDIKTGIMIEIPSAALMSDAFARAADFFSIGTNDLIQYTLACDRTNEKVNYLYDPLNRGVLNLIRTTVENAHAQGIPVSLCGEMAGQPLYAAVLLGLGIDALSMAPSLIPEIKKVIRELNAQECKTFVESLFQYETETETREAVIAFMRANVPIIDVRQS